MKDIYDLYHDLSYKDKSCLDMLKASPFILIYLKNVR